MPTQHIIRLFLILFFICIPLFAFVPKTHSDQLDDITNQIKGLTDSLNKSVAATKPLQSQLQSMQDQVKQIKNQVAYIDEDILVKKKQIDDGYKDLANKEAILNHTIRDFYIKSYYNSPLLVFFSAGSASDLTRTLAYQKAQTDQDKSIITNIALTITNLEQKKEDLKNEQVRLITAKANLDQQSTKLDGIIKGAEQYQQQVSSQIAALSAQQQAILNARSGSFTVTIGDSALADDPNASVQGFRSNAPGGSFAVFSFGAYTHRNGMSQYGALGRFTSGKDTTAESILQAYFPNATLKKDYSVPANISVDGIGQRSFEDQYMKGIYEMPGSWPVEVLKAQAVAARTFALNHTNNGHSSICTTEACQVFQDNDKGGSWDDAVNQTKGWVLVDGNGNPVSAQFSSTAGGWSNTSSWDTTDGNGGSNLFDKAYEKIAGSPWFYKAWYTQGYSVSSNTCGRSNPWLSSDDIADIMNATFVLFNGGSSDETSRITPVTTSCWNGNPYSHDELRSVSDKYGGGISNVTGVTVQQGNGSTNQVIFETDKGEKTISGINFKTAFNLRAPGYMSIPQNGFAFFNIEHK